MFDQFSEILINENQNGKKSNGAGPRFRPMAGNCWPGPKVITARSAHAVARARAWGSHRAQGGLDGVVAGGGPGD
jgi:hypothetical protein